MVVDSRVSDKKGKPVGAILKEARETRGLSLDDASRVTRIGKGYLQALEDGMYYRLPDVVYAKGFLRAYSTYLKLPENEIVQLYEKDTADSDAGPDNQERVTESGGDKKRRVLPAGRSLYVMAAFIAVAAVASYLLSVFPFVKTSNESRTVVTPPKANTGEHDLPPEQAAGVAEKVPEPETKSQSVEEPAEEVPVTIPAASKGLVLKIKVIEDGWLDITIDETMTQHYDLKAGDLIEWKGEKSFTLDIGNSGGLEAELNGKPLKAFGEKGETTHVVLKTGENQR
jgi:cytoskeleton protein RodZ